MERRLGIMRSKINLRNCWGHEIILIYQIVLLLKLFMIVTVNQYLQPVHIIFRSSQNISTYRGYAWSCANRLYRYSLVSIIIWLPQSRPLDLKTKQLGTK